MRRRSAPVTLLFSPLIYDAAAIDAADAAALMSLIFSSMSFQHIFFAVFHYAALPSFAAAASIFDAFVSLRSSSYVKF